VRRVAPGEEVTRQQQGLSGHLLTGRDAAHLRLTRMLEAGEELPVDLRDRAVVGPAGPTASSPTASTGPT
jgi:fumarate hydratase class I